MGIPGQDTARRQAIAKLRPGIDCCPFTWRCGGQPMWPTPRAAVLAGATPEHGKLDLDHFPGRIWGGPQTLRLSHRHCNRKAGQAVGQLLKQQTTGSSTRSGGRAAATPRGLNAKRRARW